MPDPLMPLGLPLPKAADLSFWRSEVDRADRISATYHSDWQENIEWYKGKSPDALKATQDNVEFVNVNVDFYQVEQKIAQLFYDTPELQYSTKGSLTLVSQMPGQPGLPASPDQQNAIGQAHRALMNELLGEDHADVLARAVHPGIKDCLCVSGTGMVIVGYQPTLRSVPAPAQYGAILDLAQPVSYPIHESWYALRDSPKKFLRPADWHSTDWDRAPWLGYRFRMPFAIANKEFSAAFATQPDFKGTTTRDEHVLAEQERSQEASGLNYVDGVVLWYRATVFDDTAEHPELYRELVLIDGVDIPARHRDSPHQTIGPDGRMTADSLIGNPIHPLTIRDVPDSSFTPSDSQMTRPLVRELCKFRTQMVQSREADRQRVLYDSSKLPPEVVEKITNGTLGDLIPVEEGALVQGVAAIMAEVVKGQPSRQTYVANDYITRDIEKTLAIDASGAGASDAQEETATKTAVVDRNRSVRLNHEQRQVLRWYLKLVGKFSALVCRYMTPQLAAPYIGQQQAMIWGQWDKKATDGRIAFKAKPDSQIKLDAAAERKFAMDLYQFTAKDPQVNRPLLLKNLFTKGGMDPAQMVSDQPPQAKPDESFTFSFKGEDLIGPQAPLVREILAQGGIQLSQDAVDESSGQLFKQMALGIRDASGKATPAAMNPAEHGGPADQVRPLSKQSADQSGNRPGKPTGEQAA